MNNVREKQLERLLISVSSSIEAVDIFLLTYKKETGVLLWVTSGQFLVQTKEYWPYR